MYLEFTDLKVWQAAHTLTLKIYKICKHLPQYEQYGLGQQIRRSAVSVTSNISEGFGRTNIKEKLYFYAVARGSIFEVHNQLLLMRDLQFCSIETSEELLGLVIQVKILVQSLIKSTKNR